MLIRIEKNEIIEKNFNYYKKRSDLYFHIGIQGIFRIVEVRSHYIIFKLKLESNDSHLSSAELKNLIINKINIVEA